MICCYVAIEPERPPSPVYNYPSPPPDMPGNYTIDTTYKLPHTLTNISNNLPLPSLIYNVSCYIRYRPIN